MSDTETQEPFERTGIMYSQIEGHCEDITAILSSNLDGKPSAVATAAGIVSDESKTQLRTLANHLVDKATRKHWDLGELEDSVTEGAQSGQMPSKQMLETYMRLMKVSDASIPGDQTRDARQLYSGLGLLTRFFGPDAEQPSEGGVPLRKLLADESFPEKTPSSASTGWAKIRDFFSSSSS